MKQLDILSEYVLKRNICHKKDYLLKFETYFKTGGRVKFFLMPNEKGELVDLIMFMKKHDIEFKLIGLTTNVLFFDEIDYTVVISTKNLNDLAVSHDFIQVSAGYPLCDFVRVCVINQFEGFEGLEGIPGTIGGAIFMNAGAYNYTVSDNVISVECISEEGEVIILKKNKCNFDYRTSIFKNTKLIILSALFHVVKGNQVKIARKIEVYHIARHSYQEFSYPNLGSMISLDKDIYKEIFKNKTMYLSIYFVIKGIIKNPFAKFIMRKRPSNRFFNFLLKVYISKKRLESDLGNKGSYFFSDKSANILINTGDYSGTDYYNHIRDISKLSGGEGCIENEVVINPAYNIRPTFQGTLAQIHKDNNCLKGELIEKNSINNNTKCK